MISIISESSKMAKAKSKVKGAMTRTKNGKKIKKPNLDVEQKCVLISVSTANSRKREANRERVRQFRAKKAAEKKKEDSKENKSDQKKRKKK